MLRAIVPSITGSAIDATRQQLKRLEPVAMSLRHSFGPTNRECRPSRVADPGGV
ncbi:MAG: hypothetical protein R3B91_21235 [Planctomycetaceae bacterium]